MVKQSKEYFDKMKRNLIEKIEMVSASRCNLLSHTLPSYQTELLKYLDQAAIEFHQLLVALRAQTQHQYKVKKFTEEIRVLESEESPPSTSTASASEDDKDKAASGEEQTVAGKEETATAEEEVAEKPLIDMLQDELVIEPPYPPPTTLGGNGSLVPPPEQQQGIMDGEAKEEKEPSHQSEAGATAAAEPTPESEMARLMDLLSFGDQSTSTSESTDEGSLAATPLPSSSADNWEQFSAFMDSPASNEPDHTGWEKELLQSHPQESNLPPELEDLFATDSQLDSLVPESSSALAAPSTGEMSFDPLLESSQQPLASAEGAPSSSEGLEQLGLDPSLFHQPYPTQLMPAGSEPFSSSNLGGPPPSLSSPLLPLSHPPSSLPISQAVAASQHKPPTWRPPPGSNLPRDKKPSAEGEEEQKKKASWMDVFAHLDPIANEKA